MSAQPLVSVIVPTRDRAALLGTALRSVLEQDADLELVVVDDASSDATPSFLAELAAGDPRVRVITHPAPTGQQVGRNEGLDAALGRYVAFLDDDDWWLPGKLTAQLDRLDATGAAVCTTALVIDAGGRAVLQRGPRRDPLPAEVAVVNFLGSLSSAMVDREALAGPIPRFDPEFHACQDWDWYLRCADATRPGRPAFTVVPSGLTRHCSHAGERVTTSAKRVPANERMLAVHGRRLSPTGLAYQQARNALLAADGARENLRAAARIAAHTRPRVTTVLAAEILAAHLGQRFGDPGLSLRLCHRATRALLARPEGAPAGRRRTGRSTERVTER